MPATRDLEIEKSAFVECDVVEPSIPDEPRHLLRLAEQSANPLQGVVAAARPEKEGFKANLDTIVGHRKRKGIRRIQHTLPGDFSQSQVFIENIHSLASYGLSFDIGMLARQLPAATRLIPKCPDVMFILHHCGLPK